MPKFLIEVSQPEKVATKQIKDSIDTIGSHFATRADWRHAEGVSTGTLVVDVNDRGSAIRIIPPNMRSSAHIFPLESISMNSGLFLAGSQKTQPSYEIAA